MTLSQYNFCRGGRHSLHAHLRSRAVVRRHLRIMIETLGAFDMLCAQHGVHQAAVLAAAALCGLPAMASNETLEQALLAERGDGKKLSNHAHTAAGALRMLEEVKAGRSLQPFVA